MVAAKEINAKGQGVWITIKKIPGDLSQVSFKFKTVEANIHYVTKQ